MCPLFNRKLPDPVIESSEEKSSSKLPRSQSGGKANTAYANNQLYQAPTKNYNPKLERITEDISSISNSVDSNLKTISGTAAVSRNPFHQHLPTTQYSRRSSSADESDAGLPQHSNAVPTMLVNTNASSDNNSNNSTISSIRPNLQQQQQQTPPQPAIKNENGVILSVRRIENNPFAEEETDDDDDVVVSKASL